MFLTAWTSLQAFVIHILLQLNDNIAKTNNLLLVKKKKPGLITKLRISILGFLNRLPDVRLAKSPLLSDGMPEVRLKVNGPHHFRLQGSK